MNMEIHPENAGLLVVDYQERLSDAMPQDVFDQSIKNCQHLMHLAQEMECPTLVTEQYPKGLGPTVAALSQWTCETFSKTSFSAWRDPQIREQIESQGKHHWILVGMETHICVFQTARDLVNHGYDVWVPSDAVVSRRRSDWKTGLSLMRETGAHLSSTEAVLFDLLKEGKGDIFKGVSRRIR